jgi:hypothetical protein
MSWKGKRGILLSESVFLKMLIVRKRNYYSIGLPAVTDANYKFIAVDVGLALLEKTVMPGFLITALCAAHLHQEK